MANGRDNRDRVVLCWLATIGPDGAPNVSPKEIHHALDARTFLIADIASARSVRNIRANPRVCVSMIDVFRQRGTKLEGRATILAPDDPQFEALAAPLLAMTGGHYPIRHVIRIFIETTSPVRAPSYHLAPDQTEDEKVAIAHETYGVRPLV